MWFLSKNLSHRFHTWLSYQSRDRESIPSLPVLILTSPHWPLRVFLVGLQASLFSIRPSRAAFMTSFYCKNRPDNATFITLNLYNMSCHFQHKMSVFPSFMRCVFVCLCMCMSIQHGTPYETPGMQRPLSLLCCVLCRTEYPSPTGRYDTCTLNTALHLLEKPNEWSKAPSATPSRGDLLFNLPSSSLLLFSLVHAATLRGTRMSHVIDENLCHSKSIVTPLIWASIFSLPTWSQP